jgi:hypothetical protein
VPAPTSDSLRLELDVPAEARVGSTVPITLRVRNAGERPIDLHLRGRTIAFDVIVRRPGGEPVWRRLEHETIPGILRLETLGPGRVLELHAEWHLDPDARAGAATALYHVEGLLLTDGAPLRTDTVTLRVLA